MEKWKGFVIMTGLPLALLWLALGLSADFGAATVCIVVACILTALAVAWIEWCVEHFDL